MLFVVTFAHRICEGHNGILLAAVESDFSPTWNKRTIDGRR